MKNILPLLSVFFLFFNCFNKNNIKEKNCFKNDTNSRLSLGKYAMGFNDINLDSALYYNNLSFNECSTSKKILSTRLDIFDLKQNYSKCIETIDRLVKSDSIDRSEKLDLSFKKFTYFACIDSIKYKDSMRKEYTYLLNQPKKWNDSLIYQLRLGLLEYQLFGNKTAMKRFNKLKGYNVFTESTIWNIENGNIEPFIFLIRNAHIYHTLNDNREKAIISN